jgi:hypothetical protein
MQFMCTYALRCRADMYIWSLGKLNSEQGWVGALE